MPRSARPIPVWTFVTGGAILGVAVLAVVLVYLTSLSSSRGWDVDECTQWGKGRTMEQLMDRFGYDNNHLDGNELVYHNLKLVSRDSKGTISFIGSLRFHLRKQGSGFVCDRVDAQYDRSKLGGSVRSR